MLLCEVAARNEYCTARETLYPLLGGNLKAHKELWTGRRQFRVSATQQMEFFNTDSTVKVLQSLFGHSTTNTEHDESSKLWMSVLRRYHI